jgi:hypothetical protein
VQQSSNSSHLFETNDVRDVNSQTAMIPKTPPSRWLLQTKHEKPLTVAIPLFCLWQSVSEPERAASSPARKLSDAAKRWHGVLPAVLSWSRYLCRKSFHYPQILFRRSDHAWSIGNRLALFFASVLNQSGLSLRMVDDFALPYLALIIPYPLSLGLPRNPPSFLMDTFI